jgi:hypothetical protein
MLAGSGIKIVGEAADASSTRTEKFGSGAIQRDQPGKKSR